MSMLDEQELAKLLPAEAHAFPSPIPTQFVSSDEFMPTAQTERQKQVEGRIKELDCALAKIDYEHSGDGRTNLHYGYIAKPSARMNGSRGRYSMCSVHAWTLALSIGALSATAVQAQQGYPSKPIRFIMAYPPGGSSEMLARPIANEMTKSLGQPVVFDYKPGGGTTIAADITAKSPADGYTIVMLLTAHAINATLMPKLPYDTIKDFSYITLAAVQPLIVVVNAQAPIRSLTDLIAAAKANPGKLNYASAGPGNTSHLAVEHFKAVVGVNMTHVPYKGSGPAITALLGREVDLIFDSLSTSLPHAKAGKFRALAVSTSKRSHAAPDVPTIHEAGVPNFDVSVWYGIFSSPGTPAGIVQRLNAEIIKAMAVAETKKVIEGAGYTIVGGTPAQLETHLKSEIARWGKVIKDAGVTAEQ